MRIGCDGAADPANCPKNLKIVVDLMRKKRASFELIATSRYVGDNILIDEPVLGILTSFILIALYFIGGIVTVIAFFVKRKRQEN